MISKIKALFRRSNRASRTEPGHFLHHVSGVIHVGANTGQERRQYHDYGLKVVWVEPVPHVYARLRSKIRRFKNQRAIEALVTDANDKEYEFNVASNNGASSSIFRFKHHQDIWPEVNFTATLKLKSITLPALLARERIDLSQYQALIIDTQGSELLVLKGCLPVLNNFQFIKTEVADFESYEGCCQLSDIDRFMTEHGYKEFHRKNFASRSDGGSYYEIVYKKS